MHYGIFADWVQARTDELVGMGVPRHEAESIMQYVDVAAKAAELTARSEQQFLLEFKEVGSEEMAKRRGTSGQAIRKQRMRILRKSQPLVARTVAG